ncbi:RNA chaperone Hfq [Caloramator sp. mosi_1]|uniref:RNA chaperone Hfq n=1 Tax=Caloramator sp. mosi_1 TaxID=3023090 RepID=UPI00235FC6E4|nr:RNA chaperone Hfq [Caloramator sp. mosi_1]WDC83944.1 RNA chaperone Hfq [Caloramator sp. mosi_1]WDC83982.1 RNA chaperone Hfq [Caloramator sp. mosi_1]
MAKSVNNLQDVFLNNARKGKIPVSIHLVNGFQLKGLVRGFDSFTIILESEGKQILVYKHSVTTVTPAKPILYNQDELNNNVNK